MKQANKALENSGQASPLPRFLRNLFRGQQAPLQPEGVTTAPAVVGERPARVFGDSEKPPKILVVDDDLVVLKAMEMKLSLAGCEVLRAGDGPEAISLARTAQPDVILLDIGLPADVSVAWDGIRVMQWIKRLENGSAPPAIIMTGSTSPKLRESALACGATAFFQKPVKHDELISAITEAWKQRKTQLADVSASPARTVY
jgi:CheY-like chemotaxis protein